MPMRALVPGPTARLDGPIIGLEPSLRLWTSDDSARVDGSCAMIETEQRAFLP